MSDYSTEQVHTLETLRGWNRTAPSLAVIGKPVAHSRSPLMHNAALDALAAPKLAGWRYFKFEIEPEQLGEALELFRQRGFAGLNLTLPHKVIALEHVVRLDDTAAAAGAANVLVPESGGYAGHNTDGAGFLRAMRETFGVGAADAPAVILGAGGAARGVAAALLSHGCRELWIGNRSVGRLEELLDALRKNFTGAAVRGFLLADGAFPELPSGATLVNATALGLKPGDPSPVPAGAWRRGMRAFDIVYGTGETAFLRDAKQAGVPTVDGMPMLCWQGALAFELWTGIPAPAAVMLGALLARAT